MRKTMSIVQIETRQGVENIDAILNVKGIDGVLIGPVIWRYHWAGRMISCVRKELNMIQRSLMPA